MFREATVMIAASNAPTSQIGFYVTALGGISAVANLLEVTQKAVHSWLGGVDAPPAALFFLDEAYCEASDAPLVDEEVLVP